MPGRDTILHVIILLSSLFYFNTDLLDFSVFTHASVKDTIKLNKLNRQLSDYIRHERIISDGVAQVLHGLRDFEQVNNELLQYNQVNDSPINSGSAKKIEELRESFKAEERENEIIRLEAAHLASENRNKIYLISSVSIFILATVFLYVIRLRAHKNRLLLIREHEIDRLKSNYFTNISHELRTPLTLIVGPVAEMLLSESDPDIKKKLSIINYNAQRLLSLVNQLLELAKIESGNITLNKSASDIMLVIRGIVLSFDSLLEKKNIELAFQTLPYCHIMEFDRQKIETVLVNIIGNALRFSPDGERIELITEYSDGKLNISVINKGEGIKSEDIDYVFDRYFQSNNNSVLNSMGTGIGLALSKELVELHRGTITVTSEPDNFTEFKISLPGTPTRKQAEELSIESDYNIQQSEKIPHSKSEVLSIGQKPLLLIIDDKEDVRNYVYDILNPGYEIILTPDGEKGIEVALDKIPELIICDIKMPKKDGYEVCQTLKRDQRTSHIPIILLTAKAELESRISGLGFKADEYLTKPFIPVELIARINNLIQSRRMLHAIYHREDGINPTNITENSLDQKFLKHVIEIVESEIGNEQFGVEQLSLEVGLSRSQLHRKLTALVNQSPNRFIRSFRLKQAYDLLFNQSATTAEIAFMVGFSSPSYFTKCFHDEFGILPSELLSKGILSKNIV